MSHSIPESPCTDTKKNTGFCFCQFIKKNGDFPAISVKERNCAAADVEKWIILYRIGFCHFSSQCEQVSSKMSRSEHGLGPTDMKVYFQERGL